MKKIYCLICFILMSVALFAQAPESFSYQAMVRDSSNQPKVNSPVSIKIDILQGSAAGNVVYEETHTVTTDENGMLSLAIGTGTAVHGSFANIDWGAATYFLKSEMDPDGGNNYSLTTTQQLVSVPYALYAKSAGNTLSAEDIQQMFDNLRNELANTIDSLNEEIGNLTEELSTPCPGSVSDDEGNLYPTIKLGRQCWMAENLRSTTFLGWPMECGDTIGNSYGGGWFYYSSGDVSKTGYVYTSDVAMVGEAGSSSAPSNIQGLCPAGWHLPSVAEWSQLFSYVGSNSSYCCSSNPSYIAKALASQSGWSNASTLCSIGNMPEYNNATGFNIRPDIYNVTDELGNVVAQHGDMAGYLTSDPSVVYFSTENPTVDISSGSGMGFIRCVYGGGNNASDPYASEIQTPSVSTGVVSNVTAHSLTAEGTVTDNGATVTERGICWSASNHTPTIYDNHSVQGSGNGSFTANLDNLMPGTTYYVRAYVTNDAATTYGSVVMVTTNSAPCVGNETVTDLDGNVYNTVQIGNQCWMKENLRITKFADGTPITYGGTNNSTTTAYYYYPDNDSSIITDYGLLYNWKAAMGNSTQSSMSNPSGVQGICPAGWHLPSEPEWEQLISNGGLSSECGNARDFASQSGWNSYNCNPQWSQCCQVGYDMSMNNATGFSAMPAGYFGYLWSQDGFYYSTTGKGTSAVFLCTSQNKNYCLYNSSGTFVSGSNAYGSVRCVKD